jgi:hypothetical protein
LKRTERTVFFMPLNEMHRKGFLASVFLAGAGKCCFFDDGLQCMIGTLHVWLSALAASDQFRPTQAADAVTFDTHGYRGDHVFLTPSTLKGFQHSFAIIL